MIYNETRYIYVLTQINTGKKYVGKTMNVERRIADHMNALMRGDHRNKAMQADFDKYHGDYNVSIVDTSGRRNACRTEKKWMIKLHTYDERYGYNNNDVMTIATRQANGMPVKIGNRWKRGPRPPKVQKKYIPANEWLKKQYEARERKAMA